MLRYRQPAESIKCLWCNIIATPRRRRNGRRETWSQVEYNEKGKGKNTVKYRIFSESRMAKNKYILHMTPRFRESWTRTCFADDFLLLSVASMLWSLLFMEMKRHTIKCILYENRSNFTFWTSTTFGEYWEGLKLVKKKHHRHATIAR